MTADTEIHISLVKEEPSNLHTMANRIEMVNSLFVVSIWSLSVEQEQVEQEQYLTDTAPADLSRHSAYVRDARQQADRLELVSMGYSSPLWFTVGSTLVTGVPAIGYGVLRMYEKVLDLRVKKSNVDLLRLTNEQIMDDLRFNQGQKHLMRMAGGDKQIGRGRAKTAEGQARPHRKDPEELHAPAAEDEVVPQGIPSRPANELADPIANELANVIKDAAAALQLVSSVGIHTEGDAE